ncbi:MAG TPA: iron-sulfur cluster assembly protein, partial [Pirellulales bacterium]|nr:iron-sulfur cluster assembly protein [Pirellulales bacterium]
MPDGSVTEASIVAALNDFLDPETGRSVVDQGQVHDVKIDGGRASLRLDLSTFMAPLWKETQTECAAHVKAKLPSLTEVQVSLGIRETPVHKLGDIGLAAKAVIAVGSGKGGVGKSTI